MATSVYPVEELILDDGTTITCKPGNIKIVRKGNELLRKMDEVDEPEYDEDGEELDENGKGVRRLLDIVCLCLKRQRPDFEKKVPVDPDDESQGKKTVTNYELMEELFDLPTMFKVIELYLGVKLNDPKLLEAAIQLADLQAKEERAGTNSSSRNSKRKPSSSEAGEASTS